MEVLLFQYIGGENKMTQNKSIKRNINICLTEKQLIFIISLLNAHSSVGAFKGNYAFKIVNKLRRSLNDTK
jgi:hypothetical protein